MGRNGFRYVSHTADIAFVAKGEDIEECIENACSAMLNAMLDLGKINKSDARVKSLLIKESAESIEYLAWFTLEHVLEEIDDKRLNAFEFRIERFFSRKDKFNLHGRLYYRDSKEDCVLLGIKAVTPHGMKMVRRNGTYSLKVVADV